MKKILFFFSLLFLIFSQKTVACYANFTYQNACAGDTVWFTGSDMYALHFWDFGDTLSGNPNTSHDTITYHVYTQPGTYIVTHFVNIGAEWAYATEVLTIGTDCFAAFFTADCGGGNYVNLQNQSIGSNLTYSWNFGAGANDTSTLANPGWHAYTNAGVYTISLTISDGTQSDTYTQNFNTQCITPWTLDNFMMVPCAGDSAYLYYTNTPANYPVLIWNFGDPASGVNNVITGNGQPKHVFATPGVYPITLIVSDGVVMDTFVNYLPVVDCRVFPGDCDRNGFVEAEDIFVLGLQYGITGTPRPNATTTYTPQSCPNWNPNGLGMYLDMMVNEKHADANGDGIVNQADVSAIQANLGQSSRNWNTLSFMNADDNDPKLILQGSTTQGIILASGGMWLEIPILLGDANIQAKNIYGFSTIIPFDTNMIAPNSISVIYDNSWLGAADSLLHIEKVIDNDIHIGFTRFNHQNVATGMGEIARLRLQIKNNVNGNTFLLPSSDTKLLSHWNGFGGGGGVEKLMNVHLATTTIIITSVSTENELFNSVQIYPNPANEFISIVSAEKIEAISLFDMTGKRLLFAEKTDKIDISSFTKGIYVLEVVTSKGKFVKKVVVE